MGVARILKEPNTLELDDEEEEVEVADEVKRSGISPLDYYVADKPQEEEEEEEEDIVDETADDISDDFTESLTNVANGDIPTSTEEEHLDVNDDSDMNIDVVNLDSPNFGPKTEKPSREIEAPQKLRASELGRAEFSLLQINLCR